MIYELKVVSKERTDPKGQELLAEIKRTLKISSIKNIRTAKVYRLEGITKTEAQKLTQTVLYESIGQKIAFQKPVFVNADQKVEVAYKPGVMNPEVASILKAASDLNIKLKAADSSWRYAFYGKITKEQLQEIISRLLVNETVEHVVNKPPKTLIISAKSLKTQIVPIRKLSDEKLMELSKNKLFLNLEEMKVIHNYFKKIGRDPTDCEVETLAQTWSEHCVHKTFKAKLIIDGKLKKPLIDRIKSTAKNNQKLIISAFDDNSGVIDFYDGWAINGKVETHNSPSAIEPYGGAMTGSGGVFRDVLGTGQGAKPIISTDIFCFAPPDLSEKNLPPGCLPPDYLLRKVVAGVRDYGNRVGIPTNNGSVHFHKDFRAKPTVAVGSFGVLPKKYVKKGKVRVGDLILTIGGATGRDGIHGATFSSGEMTHKTQEVSGSAVQIGNAIEEKRIIDAVLAVRNQNLIRAITDCGAGGYSSAIGEMAAGVGAVVNLEKVQLKYKGLAPWEIFLSESQERMVLAIDPKNLKKVENICKLFNVQSAVIGKFDGSKKLKVYCGKEKVCDLSMKFIHEGLPQRKMIGKTTKSKLSEKLPPHPKNMEKIWRQVMSHGNVCSKEPIVRLYDHNVQGATALHPFGGVNFNGPNDGAIVKPLIKKPYGLVVTHGLNPVLNNFDPYWGSVWAIAEAVSNFIAIGGEIDNAALIDNFIWPFPDEESLADLDKSVDACVDTAKILGMPFVSGKDSLSSTYRYPESPKRSRRTDSRVLKIPPVLLVSVFGKIPDVKKTATSDFKKVGTSIVLVGKPDIQNLGGTTYFNVLGASSSNIPKTDTKNLKKVFQSITAGIKSGEILSAHDISEGGLAAALAEMCFGGDCGAKLDLSPLHTPGVGSRRRLDNTPGVNQARPDFILFNETPGTFLIEVENEKLARKLFSGIPHSIIGKTIKEKSISIHQHDKIIGRSSIDALKKSWKTPMQNIFH